MSEVDILYQIANLKEIDYKNTLIITSLVELLIEKGLISKKELIKKAESLDNYAISQNNGIM
ncbi:hypothetical protein [Fonticella tunisiensis]|uniref:Uncharacterized protein n=1 Tax=Fonticella tunisiensis TaxID=1096341 RepID=A0A4R7K564_9CLOT|nr:hypothetical protein [Fonticella tunisiensis]TDT45991.1 hypothetical protein EDD71_14211 [Fonticella tunisiensis]